MRSTGRSGRRAGAGANALTVVVVDDRAQYMARVPASGGRVEKLIDGRRVVNSPSSGT